MQQQVLRVIAVAAMTASCAAVAQDWALSVGANYRNFNRSLDLKGGVFPGVGGDGYVNGVNPAVGLVDIYSVPTAFNQVIGGNVSLDRISYAGTSEGLDNAPGLVVEATRTFYRKDAFSLGLSLNVLALTTEADSRVRGAVSSDRFGAATQPGPMLGTSTYAYGFQQPGVGTPSTLGFVDYHVDLDAYTLGLGLAGAYEVDRFGVTCGVGPTLTLAALDAEVKETVKWADGAVVNPGQTLSHRSRSDQETDLLLGAYASLGATYKVTESVKACLEYRYDHLFSEIKNDMVEADLSGGSIQAKVVFSF